MPDPYDLIVIGGGPGGYVGAIRAAQLGLRVALVEREKVGGTCLHIGCIPTKAMLHTAELLEHLKDPRELGLSVDSVAVDLLAVQRRKARVVDQLHKGVQSLMRKNKIDVFIGEGRFLSTTKIGAALADGSETELTGKHLLLATGSAPAQSPASPSITPVSLTAPTPSIWRRCRGRSPFSGPARWAWSLPACFAPSAARSR